MTERLINNNNLIGSQGARIYISKKDPTPNDKNYAIGTIWINIFERKPFIHVSELGIGVWEPLNNDKEIFRFEIETQTNGKHELLSAHLYEKDSYSFTAVLSGMGYLTNDTIYATIKASTRRTSRGNIEFTSTPIFEIIDNNPVNTDIDLSLDVSSNTMKLYGVNNVNENFKWQIKYIINNVE